eukprot:960093-Pyramimonas_sp.AAC.1
MSPLLVVGELGAAQVVTESGVLRPVQRRAVVALVCRADALQEALRRTRLAGGGGDGNLGGAPVRNQTPLHGAGEG